MTSVNSRECQNIYDIYEIESVNRRAVVNNQTVRNYLRDFDINKDCRVDLSDFNADLNSLTLVADNAYDLWQGSNDKVRGFFWEKSATASSISPNKNESDSIGVKNASISTLSLIAAERIIGTASTASTLTAAHGGGIATGGAVGAELAGGAALAPTAGFVLLGGISLFTVVGIIAAPYIDLPPHYSEPPAYSGDWTCQPYCLKEINTSPLNDRGPFESLTEIAKPFANQIMRKGSHELLEMIVNSDDTKTDPKIGEKRTSEILAKMQPNTLEEDWETIMSECEHWGKRVEGFREALSKVKETYYEDYHFCRAGTTLDLMRLTETNCATVFELAKELLANGNKYDLARSFQDLASVRDPRMGNINISLKLYQRFILHPMERLRFALRLFCSPPGGSMNTYYHYGN